MNLYVGNLLFDVTESELRETFEQFGQVTEVRLIMDKYSGKSKGFGFIEMPSKEEAEKAIEELNDKDFNGRPMSVNVAKPKPEPRSRPGQGGFRGGPRGRSGDKRGGRSGPRGRSGNNRGGNRY